MIKLIQRLFASSLLAIVVSTPVGAQTAITSPLAEFGRNIGDDYFLVNYTRMIDYWKKLDRQSARLKLEQIGTTAEGRPMWMAIITSPENHRNLARYRDISRRLARAEDLTETEARSLAAQGKSIVWIDGGLHATEVLGAQQLIQTVYELVSRNDAETLRFLRDDIILAVPANPDGQDLVSDWYMREPDTLKRTLSRLPRLYHKYIGHDNNRDSYLASQPETQAMDSILFRAWHPQIVYNHHQTGPAGTVMFAPPFRDPFNYNFDPLVPVELDLVGAAMHTRFVSEGKPGAVMRGGANYSTWWNGGLRTTVYFHNMIGLLTETIGSPTPMQIPLIADRLLPKGDQPLPIQPQKWRFAQSLAYEMTANRAVMDVASRYRETLLFNSYRMGSNSILRGSTDTWTVSPRRVAALRAVVVRDTAREEDDTPRGTSSADMANYLNIMRNPADRDPRGYIISSTQRDFQTATKFVNALIKNGIVVHRAATSFTVAGRSYPAGSFVVKTAQAFRPHIIDMFEPQDHPDDIKYPGAAPTPPYDNAGWTLAYQMGVEFDRVLDGFSGPFFPVVGFALPPVTGPVQSTAVAYVLSHTVNDATLAVNRLLARGAEVFVLRQGEAADGRELSAGTFYIPAKPGTDSIVRRLAVEKGLLFEPLSALLAETSLKRLTPARIAVWDRYGGAMTSGWLRFVLEQFEFPYQVVFAPGIDAGALEGKFDVLLLPSDVNFGPERRPVNAQDVPAEFRDRVGPMTALRTIPRLKAFLENGGTVLAIGKATEVAKLLDVPVENALVDSAGRPLPRNLFYVPGSVLRVRVDTASMLGHGMAPEADVYYDNSPAFRLLAGAEARGVRSIAWIEGSTPLRSGWAWGQKYLRGVTQVAQARVGKGVLVLYGFDPYFRSQPHGTFKLMFNGILYRNGLGDQ
ncbi:MAG TPA: M14 metallopeptidase family protein [Gemmatimonadaceae bacterium]|nr:M14 metallopeptidase family protein [Gemmatimonadaceae bacterium]